VVSVTVALKAGFVYLVALRLLSGVVAPGTTRTVRIAGAMLAAILLLLPDRTVLVPSFATRFSRMASSKPPSRRGGRSCCGHRATGGRHGALRRAESRRF
jgi:hypothetical protein